MRKQTLLALTRSINADLKGGNQYTRSILAVKNEEELVTVYDYGTMGQFNRASQTGDLLYVCTFDCLIHYKMSIEWLKDILKDKRNDLQYAYDEVTAKGDLMTDEDLEWQYNCGKIIDVLDNILDNGKA